MGCRRCDRRHHCRHRRRTTIHVLRDCKEKCRLDLQLVSYPFQIATLPPQYGLYSSFVGVMIYCLFATSKDVTIGPVAVMSLTVASIISAVQSDHPNQWDSPLIATTLSFLCGFIVLGIGLLRIGWIVEFIPIVAISAFMTGSAINIAVGQVAGLLGISGVK